MDRILKTLVDVLVVTFPPTSHVESNYHGIDSIHALIFLE